MHIVTNLEFKLGAAKVSPLLLPEVVGFDDECNVDARWERLLKDLQQRLNAVPFRTTHVHNDREAMPRHFLTKREEEKRTQEVTSFDEEHINVWQEK